MTAAKLPVIKDLDAFVFEGTPINEGLVRSLHAGSFLPGRRNIVLIGGTGTGKTHLATALGHIAIRRRLTVGFHRADKLFTRLRAARLDHTVDAEIRRLAAVDVLIIDDFALRPLDATETSDFYEIVVERHRAKTTIMTSNREPAEWLTMTADTLLAELSEIEASLAEQQKIRRADPSAERGV